MDHGAITQTSAMLTPYASTTFSPLPYLLSQHYSVLDPVLYQFAVDYNPLLHYGVPQLEPYPTPVHSAPKVGSIIHIPSNPQAASIIWQASDSQSKASLGHPAVIIGISPCGQYIEYCPMTTFSGRRAADKWANTPWAIAHRRKYLSLRRANDIAETRHGSGCGKSPSDRDFAVQHGMPLLEFVGGHFTKYSYVNMDSCWIELSVIEEYKSGNFRLTPDSLEVLESYMDVAKKIRQSAD